MLDQVQLTTLSNGIRVITAPQAEGVAVGSYGGFTVLPCTIRRIRCASSLSI